MPLYLYENPETGEVKEVLQKMSEPHEYEEGGVGWLRVWVSPNAAVNDNLISADTTQEEFVRKTKEKNYNVGEMWDLSKELGEKRKQVSGEDHVRKKTEKESQERVEKGRQYHAKQRAKNNGS